MYQCQIVPPVGFEPRTPGSEPSVLPLNYRGMRVNAESIGLMKQCSH